MKLSVVIPIRRELRLEWMINQIKKVCDDLPEIVLVFDGDDPRNYCIDYPNLKTIINPEPLGTGPSRHIGILHASHDAVFTTDGHVFIQSPTFFSEMLGYIKEFPDDILCCKMKMLSAERMYFNKGEAEYTGARVALRVGEESGINIITAKWSTNDVGIIPCVMGACYGLRRSRYVGAMCQPLAVNKGWGHDEETLSIVNWICGGESRLVDLEVGHPFGAAKPQGKREVSATKTWSNRMAMLSYLPMSETLRAKMREWSFRNSHVSAKRNVVFGEMNHKKVGQLRNHLGRQERDFNDFVSRFKCIDSVIDEDFNKKTASALFPITKFDTDKKISCDRHIAIAAYSRSGSHCVADWICSQMVGHVRYASAINLSARRMNDPRVFIKGNKGLPTTDMTGIEGEKTYVVSLERADPSGEIDVPWIDAPERVSVILVRNPFNWLASLRSHGTGFFRSIGYKKLFKVWAEYAEAYLNRKDCVVIYYDRFVKDKEYRDFIAEKIGVDRRSDRSLSRVSKIGRGSSFDGILLDGSAEKMKTDERWKQYEDEDWMKIAMGSDKIQYLLSEIEEFVLT